MHLSLTLIKRCEGGHATAGTHAVDPGFGILIPHRWARRGDMKAEAARRGRNRRGTRYLPLADDFDMRPRQSLCDHLVCALIAVSLAAPMILVATAMLSTDTGLEYVSDYLARLTPRASSGLRLAAPGLAPPLHRQSLRPPPAPPSSADASSGAPQVAEAPPPPEWEFPKSEVKAPSLKRWESRRRSRRVTGV